MSDPIGFPTVECDACGQPLTLSKSRTRWSGDYEISRYHLECQSACQVQAILVTTRFIPIDVARMQGGE